MPKPNPDRRITEEMQLPARIAHEREQRGMSYEGLAQRMAQEGCPIAPSGIYKTEREGRRVVVEELVAYARVFGIPVERLLLPAEVAKQEGVVQAWERWQVAYGEYWQAKQAADEADEAAKQAARVLLAEVGDDPALLESVGWLRWGGEWPQVKDEFGPRFGNSVKQIIHVLGFRLPDPEKHNEEVQDMSRQRTRRGRPTLYHYCRPLTLVRVIADQEIRPTIPMLRDATADEMWETQATHGLVLREDGSPLVVWLTDAEDPGQGSDHGLGEPKRHARLVVDSVRAVRWREWVKRQPTTREWVRHVDRIGGGKGDHWWVVEGPVPVSEVARMEARIDGGWQVVGTPAEDGAWSFAQDSVMTLAEQLEPMGEGR